MPDALVAVAYENSRAAATRMVVDTIGYPSLGEQVVLIKPNFNTADPAPGSTHIDTLRTTVDLVKEHNPSRIIVGDRSGPADTTSVFEEKGVFDLGEEMGFECLVFDKMPEEEWIRVKPAGAHWRKGFLFAKPVIDADVVIGLCCLKTHQFGGHFTMSLKLATGMVHSRNMTELHASLIHQRKMIAEINAAYEPAFVVMDGVEAFYEGGPMTGKKWKANLTFASKDRIALDAVGVASLKMHGTTRAVQSRSVFQQDQIRRAAELGLGVTSPDDIEMVAANEEAEEVIEKIQSFLSE